MQREQTCHVNRLPPEIMSQVFVFCLGSSPTVQGYQFPDYPESSRHNPTPFFLSSICQYWREVAFLTRDLWRVLNIDIYEHTPLFLGQLVREWVGRSGQLPLFIRIWAAERMPATVASDSVAKSIVVAINEVLHRVEVLCLHISSALLSSLHCSHSRDSMALKKLTLFSEAPKKQDNMVNFNPGFNAPSPHEACLVATNFYLHFVRLSFDNLAKARLGDVTLSEAVNFLNLAYRLVEILFTGVDERPSPLDLPLPQGRIINLSVQTVHICMYPDLFWDHVSFPALSRLILEGEHANGYERLLEFVEISECQITYLNSSQVGVGHLLPFLRRMSAIQSLQLLKTDLRWNLLEFLANTTNIPYLRNLKLSGVRIFPWRDLPELIDIRRQSGHALHSLNVEILCRDHNYLRSGCGFSWSECQLPVDHIDKDTLQRLQGVYRQGDNTATKVQLGFAGGRVREKDLFRRSLGFHGIEVEDSYESDHEIESDSESSSSSY